MLVETIWFTISSMPIVSLTARICSLDCFLRLFDAIVTNEQIVCSRPFNERHTFYTRYKFTMNFERGGGEHEDRIRTIRHRYIASVT